MTTQKYLTVSAINKYIKYRFDNDTSLKNVYIQAEMSNVRLSKGMLYFVLKDEFSEISAMMFSTQVAKLTFKPFDGMKVIAFGSVNSYEKKGTYSFVTTFLQEDEGLGKVYLEFIRIKELLSKEGLFDDKYKKKIPSYATNIGVVTSPNGEAIKDIIFTINKRFPLATIYIYPAIVQGDDAPISLIKGLNKANEDKIVDVIIIGRGGGSSEDLSCFNDEGLARAIFASKIPVISAVGHEGDFTIADFVSDLRAPTPTGAAMMATYDTIDILNDIDSKVKSIVSIEKNVLTNKYNEYNILASSYYLTHFIDYIESKLKSIQEVDKRLNLLSPVNLLEKHDRELSDLSLRLGLLNLDKKCDNFLVDINNLEKNVDKFYNQRLNNINSSINGTINKLILLNPLNILSKGYSVVYKNSDVVSNIDMVDSDDILSIRLSDGRIDAKVINKTKENLK